MNNQQNAIFGIQSTAGAVPIRNEKGEVSMQKVKVQRYISGKRPEYAQYVSSDEESEDDDFIDRNKERKTYENHQLYQQHRHNQNQDEDNDNEFDDDQDRDQQQHQKYSRIQYNNEEIQEDSRLRRLDQIHREQRPTADDRLERRRHIHEPEIVESDEEELPQASPPNQQQQLANKSDDDGNDDDDNETDGELLAPPPPPKLSYDNHQHHDSGTMSSSTAMRSRRIALGSDSESDTELSDTEIERRRQRIRAKMLQQRKEEEVLLKEEEKQSESSDSESSEYEEETESEEENEPRLKPLFVRKRDRATIAEKEKEAAKQRQLEHEAKKVAKERRKQTLRLVEDSIKKDLEKMKPEGTEPNIDDVCTEDENDEVDYESWKLRELKRIKRDREEKEALERERQEVDRLRTLTEEERRQEQRLNPKTVTNKASKGKYKFLQKYFHRGAFYLDEEDDVLKRDFAQATLEDHFDKTILPKVMQVKNFGRCGRTKYTHLVDQDTTQFDSPWYTDSGNNVKFHAEKGGGMRQVFDKPTLIKRKKLS